MDKKINLFLLIIFFVLFSSSTLVFAVDCPIPDTGQTRCYDDSKEITCPSPGEDFYGQDAQYASNLHSYTLLSGGIMVQDNVTGLVWENKTDDGSVRDRDNIYNWDDAQSVFIATLNSQNFGGYSDWRLPTVKELSAIVDSNILYPGPVVNTDYFPNTVSGSYWSSTISAYDPDDAWYVYLSYGLVYYGGKSYYHYVRAVRGGQSSNNFVLNVDGTVTDTATGLMWQKETAPGAYTWQEALAYCEDLILPFGGYSDWRLPSRNELQSIVDYVRHSPSTHPFFNTVLSNYWSSTTHTDAPSYAWFAGFGYGGYMDAYAKSGSYYVRAVRTAQNGPPDTSTTITAATTTAVPIADCSSEKIYGEHSEQTKHLRYFRDNVLSTTPEGQELIRLYYELSPTIVRMMEVDEEFKTQVKEIVDRVLLLIGE